MREKYKLNRNHVHKYYQTRFENGTIIYRCGVIGCTHFVQEPMILGRFSQCWRCNEIFPITLKSLRAKKLHCESCTRGRYNKPKVKEAAEVVVESEIRTTTNSLIDDILGPEIILEEEEKTGEISE